MDKNTVFEMYKLFRAEKVESIKLHRESLQHYLAFSVAVLGATIAGAFQFKGGGWIGKIILAGPVLNVFICLLAIRMCDRFYQGALECITMIIKLESEVWLRDYGVKDTSPDNTAIFPGDKHFLPERWILSKKFQTSEEFIKENLNAGVNRLTKLTFYLMIAVNVIIGIAILLAAFL